MIAFAKQQILNFNLQWRFKKGVFIHLQKTGGTSLTNFAFRKYGRKNVISHGDYLVRSIEECSKFHFISGHFGFAYAKHFLKDRYSFTFLREPRERLLSLYAYSRADVSSKSTTSQLAKKYSLEEFLALGLREKGNTGDMVSKLWNHQTTQLAQGWYPPNEPLMKKEIFVSIENMDPSRTLQLAKDNIKKLSDVGFIESYEEDSARILRNLGLGKQINLAKKNQSPNRQMLVDITLTTKKILDELTELDSELYEYAWKLKN